MGKQKNKYYRCGLFILLVLVISSCKVKHPKEILSETQMENLLYDYHMAKAMSEELPNDERYKRSLYIDYVFQKHKTTEAMFDTSMIWYTRHTEMLFKIYEKINKHLKAEQRGIDQLIALRDKKPVTSAAGDSIDVWAWQRVYYLTGYPLNNKITFTLPSDNNFQKQDSLVWGARYRFFGKGSDSVNVAVMSLQIKYSNDSVVSDTKKVLKSVGEYIGLKSDTLGDIKEVKGFIYFSPKDTLKKSLLIDSLVLMRYHRVNDTIPKIK
jgi:hypothetical protein